MAQQNSDNDSDNDSDLSGLTIPQSTINTSTQTIPLAHLAQQLLLQSDSDDDDDDESDDNDIRVLDQKDNDSNTDDDDSSTMMGLSAQQILTQLDNDDDFKNQFIQYLMERVKKELKPKKGGVNKQNGFKVGDSVDISLPHWQYRCDAEILQRLDNDEYKVIYTDPADNSEKTTIVHIDFLRGDDISLNDALAHANENETIISDLFLEGICEYKYFENLAVIIHPWICKYFFKPYKVNSFFCFLTQTELEKVIDTKIKTRNKKNEYDYISKYISLIILRMLYGSSKKSFKISCIWCGTGNVLMTKIRPRRRLLVSGVTYDQPVNILCDNCGLMLHRDDVMFTCLMDRHDVCLKCVSQKVKQFQSLEKTLAQIIFQIFKIEMIADCISEIVSYSYGKLLQFDH